MVRREAEGTAGDKACAGIIPVYLISERGYQAPFLSMSTQYLIAPIKSS